MIDLTVCNNCHNRDSGGSHDTDLPLNKDEFNMPSKWNKWLWIEAEEMERETVHQ